MLFRQVAPRAFTEWPVSLRGPNGGGLFLGFSTDGTALQVAGRVGTGTMLGETSIDESVPLLGDHLDTCTLNLELEAVRLAESLTCMRDGSRTYALAKASRASLSITLDVQFAEA